MITALQILSAPEYYNRPFPNTIQRLRTGAENFHKFQCTSATQEFHQARNLGFRLDTLTTSERATPFFPFYNSIDVGYESQYAQFLLEIDRISPLNFSTDWLNYCFSHYTTAFAHREKILRDLTGSYNPGVTSFLILIRIAEYYHATSSSTHRSISFLHSLETCFNAALFYQNDQELLKILQQELTGRLLFDAEQLSREFLHLHSNQGRVNVVAQRALYYFQQSYA